MPITPRDKYDRYTTPRTKALAAPFAGVPAGARLHISTPRHIEAEIRSIPAGTSIDIATLRAALAAREGADATCPVTTAMYLRIVIELAMEDVHSGAHIDDVTPFWRVVDADSAVAQRVAGAPEFVVEQRRAEDIAAA